MLFAGAALDGFSAFFNVGSDAADGVASGCG
jgi:hypothetical protein